MAYLHKEYIKKKRKSYIEYFRNNLESLDDFLLQTGELGASMYAVDVTEYEGFSKVPMCLYALKSSKQGGGKKLVGAISKAGTKLVDGYDSCFQSKGRKFLTLDL